MDTTDQIPTLWQREQDFVRCIAKMEKFGVKIDRELCKQQIYFGNKRMEEIIEELKLNPGERNALSHLLLDVLGLPVLKKSDKTGKPSFDKGVLEEYDKFLERSDNHVARLLLEFRGWQKTVSSNYSPYLNLVSPDGRIRPNYKLHGTKTGRLSCEMPNLQQIPRVSDKPWNGKLKKAFIPHNSDWELWELDYSQLEFRLSASPAYANCEPLIAIFNDGSRDVFTEMSDNLVRYSPKLNRYGTKTMTYTIAYGGGPKRVSSVFGVSIEEAKHLIYNVYFGQYPELQRVSERASKFAKSRGYVEYWTGRRRHFQHRDSESHKAYNSLMQGGAAEIVKDSMLRCSREIADSQHARQLLQVHDSIVFEIRRDYVGDYVPRLQGIMEDVRPDFGITFKVDPHLWGEG